MFCNKFTRSLVVCLPLVDVSASANTWINTVAILAFKAVVNLELTRRDNDRKVGLVLAQACDMMTMLLQFVSRQICMTFTDLLGW